MATFNKVLGDTVQKRHILQVINALDGTAASAGNGAGVPIKVSEVNDASNFALTVRNKGAGGALQVLSTTGATLMTVNDNGISGITIAEGSESVGVVSPGIKFGTGDDDTGLWHPTGNQVGVATGGARRVTWSGDTDANAQAIHHAPVTMRGVSGANMRDFRWEVVMDTTGNGAELRLYTNATGTRSASDAIVMRIGSAGVAPGSIGRTLLLG